MATVYIEAFSGLSGDMFLGALAGLTDSYNELQDLPKLLALKDASVEINEVNKNGIVCKHVHVIDHNAKQENEHHHHHHTHRHLSDINTIIENASIPEGAKVIAKSIFLIIGKSESKIHNIPLQKIHFHEVSGVDSIIDIVGCAILLHKLEVKKTYSTAICTGFGFVNTQHGKLPVPAPATADILAGIPMYAGDEPGERVTPTGAAILKFLDPDFDVPVLSMKNTVYGPGSKDFKAPNVLRLSLCEESGAQVKSYILETNIDDMSGELLGNDFQEGLFMNGADDFHFNPIQMKKGRSGILLSCSVSKTHLGQLSNYIFEHTSTIGIRYYPIEKNKLRRALKKVGTPYGEVQVKIAHVPSGGKRIKIEYDDLKRISTEIGKPILQLQEELINLINKL